MKPNRSLEKLKIFARMISIWYEVKKANLDYKDMLDDTFWIEGRLKMYKAAFKGLKSLNPDLKLIITDYRSEILYLFVSLFCNLNELILNF